MTRCPEVDGPFGVHKQLVVARYETGKVAGIRPLHEQDQRLWRVAGWGIRRLFRGQAIGNACSYCKTQDLKCVNHV